MKVPVVEELLKVIDGGIRWLTLMLKTSHVRKLRKAVDYAETFILLTQDIDDFDPKLAISKTYLKRQKKRRETARKRFFKHNQG